MLVFYLSILVTVLSNVLYHIFLKVTPQGSNPVAAAVIDHHLSNGGFATANLVDSASAATCEILAGVFFDNDLPVDAQAAQAL